MNFKVKNLRTTGKGLTDLIGFLDSRENHDPTTSNIDSPDTIHFSTRYFNLEVSQKGIAPISGNQYYVTITSEFNEDLEDHYISAQKKLLKILQKILID